MEPRSPTLDQISVFLAIVETGSRQAPPDRSAIGRPPGESSKRMSMPPAPKSAQMPVPPPAQSPPLTDAAWTEIRAMLDRFRPEQALDSVERRLYRGLLMELDQRMAQAK